VLLLQNAIKREGVMKLASIVPCAREKPVRLFWEIFIHAVSSYIDRDKYRELDEWVGEGDYST